MEITKKHESFLKLDKIYIKEITFRREVVMPDWDNSNIEMGIHTKVTDDNRIVVSVRVDIKKEEFADAVILNMTTVGIFHLDGDGDFSEDVVKNVVKTNTVAILFPFIRSQLALVTSQPDLGQVTLPPLNVQSIIQDMNEIEEASE
jgi:preprotein translocase subunit SecB